MLETNNIWDKELKEDKHRLESLDDRAHPSSMLEVDYALNRLLRKLRRRKRQLQGNDRALERKRIRILITCARNKFENALVDASRDEEVI